MTLPDQQTALDVVSDAGVAAVGLPAGYPETATGARVPTRSAGRPRRRFSMIDTGCRLHEHRAWPEDLTVDDAGRIARGLVVWSMSGTIEGRTTGERRVCGDSKCPGWLIGVKW